MPPPCAGLRRPLPFASPRPPGPKAARSPLLPGRLVAWAFAVALGAAGAGARGQPEPPQPAPPPPEAGPTAGAEAAREGPPAELPAVDIVAERPEGSRRAPAAQSTVVVADRFQGEGRTVAELLGTAPGVVPRGSGGPGQTTTFSLRGASADESLVLLDGIPLQGPAGGSIDLATLPASLLSRLVVSRGVLGAQLGAGALGGALEIVPLTAPARAGGGAQASYGSFGTAQLAADGGGPVGGGHIVGAVQLDTTRGDFWYARQLTPSIPDSPFTDEQRANADARRASALVRFDVRPSAATELDVLFQGTAGDKGLPGAIGSFTPDSRARDQSGLLGARLRGGEGEAVWTARAWVRGDRLEVLGLGSGFGTDCVPGTPGCDPDLSRFVAARGEGEVGLPLGAAHWLTLSAGGGGEWLSATGTGRRRRATGSLSVADEAQLLDGTLSLHPAVRADLAGDVWGISPGLAATARPFTGRAADASAFGRALAAIEFRAGVGRSFRPASFSELYLQQGASAPNPALEPERAFSIDGGVAFRGERLLLSAGLFWSRLQDLIVYEQFPPARIKPFNVGAARIQGAELQAHLQLPLGFAAEAAYSYLDAVNRRPAPTEIGQRLPYRPPHRLFARAAHRGDRLEGFFELTWTSSMPRNAYGTATLPAQLSLDAGVGARLAGTLWLDVAARNLLDDRTRQDLFQYPLPGLSVAVLARARL